ncbi:hypothetical protein ABIA35_006411 [Catenulispora sp. MAP12-49]
MTMAPIVGRGIWDPRAASVRASSQWEGTA